MNSKQPKNNYGKVYIKKLAGFTIIETGDDIKTVRESSFTNFLIDKLELEQASKNKIELREVARIKKLKEQEQARKNEIEHQAQAHIKGKLTAILPEHWIADLEQLRYRWIKKKYSSRKIQYLTVKNLCHMFVAHLRMRWDNLWLSDHYPN